MSRIAVVGTGYVGLTTGAYLAHLGHEVICADVVEAKVELLNSGEIPIVEAGLQELVREGLETGRLAFVLGSANAVPGAEFVFLCVPTPQGEDGSADLSYVKGAAREIGPFLSPGAVVINKSTVPVGSTKVVAEELGRDDVFVASNPEFLREGTAVYDCLNPDRIVVGGDSRAACERVAGLFAKLDAPVVLTDAASAETIKYAANAFLATKISFINAVAGLCEAVGADVREVVQGMGHDRRIGFPFLNPGPGWGGSCFPKDTRALISIGEKAGFEFALLRSVVEANDLAQDAVAEKVVRMAGGSLEGVKVAAWGLAFKAGTDDMRESPALAVIKRLVAAGARVRGYDPGVMKPVEGVTVLGNPYDVCQGADVLVVLTEWPEFAELDLQKVYEVMAQPRIVDARNLLDSNEVKAIGFSYDAIGRPGFEAAPAAAETLRRAA
jgi:UDPglucose 6-dehydrogenase